MLDGEALLNVCGGSGIEVTHLPEGGRGGEGRWGRRGEEGRGGGGMVGGSSMHRSAGHTYKL